MAYVDQDKKAKIAAALKTIVPKEWKYSLAVQNHSTICFNLREAPVDFVRLLQQYNDDRAFLQNETPYPVGTWVDLNPYHFQAHLKFATPEVQVLVEAIFDALNTDNFDNSDSQTDYFHVGHYVRFHAGQWNKPYICTAPLPVAA